MLRKGWILILLLGLTLAACGGTSGPVEGEGEGESNQLVIADWGSNLTDVRKKEIIEPFEEKYDVDVIIETPVVYGKIKAMVDSENVTWDVVNVDTFWVHQAAKQDLLEPLDFDVVSKEGIIPELVTNYSVGSEMYSSAISYSTDEFSEGEHPKSWEEFWDVEKYPGPRGLYKDPAETLEIALLADGVAPEDLYPLDVDRAFESLDKLRDSTELVWWEEGAQPPELLSTGSVSAVAAWNGRVTRAIEEGAAVNIEYNEGIMSSVSWIIPKGSKNKDLAMKFLDYAASADAQANFVNAIDYLPINTDALDQLSEERRESLGQTQELIEGQVLRDDEWWGDHYDEVYERFQEWLID